MIVRGGQATRADACAMTSLTTTAILIDAHGSMIGRTREESRQALNEVTTRAISPNQLIRPIGAEGLDRRGPAGSCRLFLGPGFRLGARWNRLVETVKTRKKREKTGKKWARYGLRSVKDGS